MHREHLHQPGEFYIDYSGGNFQLKCVDTLDEDDDSDVESVRDRHAVGGDS